VRVAILSIKAAGVGLTMTAASTVVFAEMTWTPGEIIQAEDRAHRIGQASSVNVYFLHIKDSIDDVIWNTIQSKLENLGQTLDGADQNLHLSQSSRAMPERGQSSLDKYLTQSQPS
jgi:SWI/SNF-related matrix-associated actin-dependent regulator 1 of chromatin subfamily A